MTAMTRFGVAALLAACAPASAAPSPQPPATVDRMIVLDCGAASAPDLSQWTPGSNAGRPVTFSDNCYLIRHHADWLIWDTGVDDDYARLPRGKVVAHHVRGTVRRTLAAQLAEVGIKPADVTLIAFSHGHFDHVGNSRLFPRAKWLVQRRERDAMFGPDPARYGFVPTLYATMRDNPTEILDGDRDVFGDGSVRIVATPGHTPGHQSLLVRLPRTGPVILTGDAAHSLDSFAQRRVPSFNADAEETRSSIDRLRALASIEGAQLWVNHDRVQSDAIGRGPRVVE